MTLSSSSTAGQPEPICVRDITDRFDVGQPTFSHHLKALRETERITVSRRGNWAFYLAEPADIELLWAVGDPVVISAVGRRRVSAFVQRWRIGACLYRGGRR